MKRPAIQCAAGLVGATLVVGGVFWTCRQLASPTQVNAASDVATSNVAFFDDASFPTASSRVRPESSLTLSPPRSTTRPVAPASGSALRSRADERAAIRPTAGSELRLAVVDEDAETLADETPTFAEVPQTLETFDAAAPLDEPLADFPNALDAPTALAAPLETETLAPALEEAPLAPALEEAPLAPAIEEAPLAPAIEEAPLAPAIEDAPLAPAIEEAPLAPAIEEAPLAPAIEEAPLAPAIEEAPLAPAIEDAPLAPAPLAVDAAPVAPVEPTFTAVPNETEPLAPVEPVGTGVPGDKKLEGAQTTQIVVEKIAPKEIQVDREAKFAVKVKNLGSAPARNLVVRDVLPVGARFVAADVASVVPNARGEFAWPPFDLAPCSEKTFEYRIIPTQEGEIGSVATVAIAAEASCRVRCVRPALEVEVVAPQEATLGSNIDLNVVVANVGTGAATNVALLETIPDGLRHPSGAVLDHALGTLAPGEKKRVPLTLQCVAPGATVNNLVVTADGDLRKEIQTEILVRAPKLELSIDGAETPYLERQTTYRLKAANVGDAAAKDVKLVAEIPTGTTFVSANNLGVYKAETRSVYWDLAELPAGAAGEIELTLTPTKIGAARLTFGGTGPLGLTAQVVKDVEIDGLPALSYAVKTSPNPVEIGKEIVYEIQLANRGTKASTNATLQIAAPEALKIVSVEGPTRYSQQNGAFVFDVVREIPAKSAVTYKVKAVCEAVGDCRVRFQLSSDDLEPLVKEENVRVYR
ncbi:MAG: DUF11 domain-containing protein [Thermoguttaceae bacterium]|nr:DUF11 domain-containing protein [Thermoguttaceae bacterium]